MSLWPSRAEPSAMSKPAAIRPDPWAGGIPTLVEVKRSIDTRSRREVVAQMLEYAAHARTSFSAERMADWLEAFAERRSGNAADAPLEAFDIDDVDSCWQTVDTNLKAERFRLVFVSDSIGIELRSIIEFLNREMSATEVLAIEVKQYTDADGGIETDCGTAYRDPAAVACPFRDRLR